MGSSLPLDLYNRLAGDKSQRERSDEALSGSQTTRSKRKAFVDFFMRLMHFWTGYKKIDMMSAHQIIFERDSGIPTSHTCFRQLGLPRDVRSKEDLYARLLTAVFTVEVGVGFV